MQYKLNEDSRNRKGGKISPRYSEAYEIVRVKGNGYTYTIKPVNPSSRGRVKDRHFNHLKTVHRDE